MAVQTISEAVSTGFSMQMIMGRDDFGSIQDLEAAFYDGLAIKDLQNVKVKSDGRVSFGDGITTMELVPSKPRGFPELVRRVEAGEVKEMPIPMLDINIGKGTIGIILGIIEEFS